MTNLPTWDGRTETWSDWARAHGFLPWQQTQIEWLRRFDATEPACASLFEDWQRAALEDDRLSRKESHLRRWIRSVRDAVAAGEPVPESVLTSMRSL